MKLKLPIKKQGGSIKTANIRKWNHKDGGEIQKHQGFVNGVNVLDSNPSMYKKIKQREKLKSLGRNEIFYMA